MTHDQLLALARIGAKARLAELTAEMDAIRAAFPDRPAGDDSPRLADILDGLARTGSPIGRMRPYTGVHKVLTASPDAPTPAKTPRQGRVMTPAQKATVSRRMKAYWKARRKAAGQ